MTEDQQAAAALRDWNAARSAHRETGRLEAEAWDRLQAAWKRRDEARKKQESVA